jgi:hypothetical protein
MDGVDGVAFDDIPGPAVVVPPPLTAGALARADDVRAAQGNVSRIRVPRQLGVASEGVDRVHEIGEAGDVAAEASAPCTENVREHARVGLERRDQTTGQPVAKRPERSVTVGAQRRQRPRNLDGRMHGLGRLEGN